MLLDHLLDEVMYEPAVLPEAAVKSIGKTKSTAKATTQEIVDAKVETAKWLEELDVVPDDEVIQKAEQHNAREAFTALTAAIDPAEQRVQLSKVTTPAAVRHLVGMLSAYDWHFVEQAKELRGYAVSQLVEETKHPDAKIRLRALELLGKVTEVALFTERVEVKKTQMSDAELEQKIKDKLNKMAMIVDATDVTDVIEMESTPDNPQEGSDEPE